MAGGSARTRTLREAVDIQVDQQLEPRVRVDEREVVGVSHGLAAFGLVIVFGFAFEWVFVTLGLVAGNTQAAQGWG